MSEYVLPPRSAALVWERAGRRCEYCRLPQDYRPDAFHLDHARPLRHGGRTAADNLTLACEPCNTLKGPCLCAVDPLTDAVVPLFNPRTDDRHVHFRSRGGRFTGLTPTGRATAAFLRFDTLANRLVRLEAEAAGLAFP